MPSISTLLLLGVLFEDSTPLPGRCTTTTHVEHLKEHLSLALVLSRTRIL